MAISSCHSFSVQGKGADTSSMKYLENLPCIYHFHTTVVMTCTDSGQLVTGSTYSQMFARINVAADCLEQVFFVWLLTVSTVHVLATVLSPPSALNGILVCSHFKYMFTIFTQSTKTTDAIYVSGKSVN